MDLNQAVNAVYGAIRKAELSADAREAVNAGFKALVEELNSGAEAKKELAAQKAAKVPPAQTPPEALIQPAE